MKVSRRRFLRGASIAALVLLNSSISAAWVRGSAAVTATGNSLLNGFDEPSFVFKNLIKNSSGGWQTVVAGNVDANGYLTSAPSSATGPVVTFPEGYAGRYRITWSGSAAYNLTLPATIYDGGALVSGLGGSNTGAVTANCTIIGNPSTGTPNGYVEFDFGVAITGAADNGSGAIRLTVASAIVSPNGATGAGYVESVGGVPNATGQWTFVRIDSTHVDLVGSTFAGSYTSGGRLVFQPFSINSLFPTGQTYSGFSNMALCRSTAPYTGDLADALSGDITKAFNQDFIDVITDLNPSILRLLDVSAINSGNITRSAYGTPSSSIAYYAFRCPPAIWAGSTTGTDAYSTSSYSDMPGSWTDGEVFQFRMVNAPSTLAVLGAANNGGKVQLILASTAGLSNGQRVAVIGYNGAGNASNGNGTWTITVDDATRITLQAGLGGAASVYTTAWTSGGTVSTATLNCGLRGAKLLCNGFGEAPSRFQTISANAVCTAIYDSLQDVLLVTPTALRPQWPLAIRVALCNKVQKDYWHQFPAIYDLASVATDTAYIRDNLRAGLKCYGEMANEPWNTNFPITAWLIRRGMCFGYAVTSAASYTGLYNRLVLGQMTTTWGARSGLKRVIQWQAANPSTGFKSNNLEGAELNGTSFPLYATAGYPNYDTAPNRPVDYCDVLSYAPYYNGAVLTASSSGGLPSSPTLSTADKNALKDAADNYATGVPANIASAFAWMDSDILAGTRNGVLGDQTLSYLNTNYYPAWQTTATTYGKPLVCYEGNYQGWYPTAAQWDAVYGSGGSTYGGVGGLVYDMWLAYKHSANFKTVIRSQWNDQRAISATLVPGVFMFVQSFGPDPTSRWALLPSDLYDMPYFTSYDALKDWNNGL